jgi:cytochrome c oxidase subunit 2
MNRVNTIVGSTKLLGLTCILAFTANIWADAGGKADGELLFQACSACHGKQAEGNADLQAPALAGLQKSYIGRQLNAFLVGARGEQDPYSQQMATMKPLLNATSIAQLSDYVSALTPIPKPVGAKITAASHGNLKQGYKYYQANCGGCHGPKADGNPMFGAPALNRLSVSYMRRQLQYFASGQRGNDSRFGRQMQLMAKTISDQKILDDVLLHIEAQP